MHLRARAGGKRTHEEVVFMAAESSARSRKVVMSSRCCRQL